MLNTFKFWRVAFKILAFKTGDSYLGLLPTNSNKSASSTPSILLLNK